MNSEVNYKVDIVVIGSTNTDMVIRTKEMPKPGETVLGGDFLMNQGGKGANQAVAAARLGASVAFIGRTGEDVFGNATMDHLTKEGLVVDYLLKDPDFPSGIATITLDEKGQNSIVVAPGANAQLSPRDIEEALSIIKSAKVILVQLEINMETVVFAAKVGHALGKKVILNPAPFVPLPDEIYSFLYAITPNETEAEALTGIKVSNIDQAEQAALVLKKRGIPIVIITMGALGAFVSTNEFTGLVPSSKMKVVDTTAAGDTFNGALAVALSQEWPLHDAVVFANKAAAFSVTKMGAQSSCPYLSDLEVLKSQ